MSCQRTQPSTPGTHSSMPGFVTQQPSTDHHGAHQAAASTPAQEVLVLPGPELLYEPRTGTQIGTAPRAEAHAHAASPNSRFPIGVPGPTEVRRSGFSWLSIVGSRSEPVAFQTPVTLGSAAGVGKRAVRPRGTPTAFRSGERARCQRETAVKPSGQHRLKQRPDQP